MLPRYLLADYHRHAQHLGLLLREIFHSSLGSSKMLQTYSSLSVRAGFCLAVKNDWIPIVTKTNSTINTNVIR